MLIINNINFFLQSEEYSYLKQLKHKEIKPYKTGKIQRWVCSDSWEKKTSDEGKGRLPSVLKVIHLSLYTCTFIMCNRRFYAPAMKWLGHIVLPLSVIPSFRLSGFSFRSLSKSYMEIFKWNLVHRFVTRIRRLSSNLGPVK